MSHQKSRKFKLPARVKETLRQALVDVVVGVLVALIIKLLGLN